MTSGELAHEFYDFIQHFYDIVSNLSPHTVLNSFSGLT